MVKFVVVGCGYIGKRHIEMINNNPECELVGLVDIRSKEECGLSDLKLPVHRTIEDITESNIEYDVACICTPNGLHYEQTMKMLELNKHVVCEKPLALNSFESENIVKKTLDKSKSVFCVMQNRYSPPSIWLKDIIDNNILGDIYMVQLNCFWNRDERYYKVGGWKGTKELDGGTLFTQFSHFIDIMYWLFGDVENIVSKHFDFNHKNLTDFEDSGIITFDIKTGGMGSLNYSTSVAIENLESSITIIGEKGSVKVGGQYMNEVETCNIIGYDMPELPKSNPPNNYGTHKGSASNHNFIFDNVVKTLKGKSQITTNVMDGHKVVDIINRMYL